MTKKVTVDSVKCQGHNRCYALAPDVFEGDDERVVALDRENPVGVGNGLVDHQPAGRSTDRARRCHAVPWLPIGSEVAVIFPILGMAIYLCGAVCLILANFKMRASIHNYYTMVEPMGINLMDTTGAVLTFFFPIYFFQYHFFNIAERKKAMGHPAV